MKKGPYSVYIMTNTHNTVLYTGVTNNLKRRVNEHVLKLNPRSFTAFYNIHKLVYHEEFIYIEDAIAREKQIKAGSRKNKIKLIEKSNKGWADLFLCL
jgi:putative endonuclease